MTYWNLFQGCDSSGEKQYARNSHNMDGSQGQSAEWKKLEGTGYILYGPIYM